MPKEKLWVTENVPETDHLMYTITSNSERTRYYINDALGRRLDAADTPLKFEKRIARMRAINRRRYGDVR